MASGDEGYSGTHRRPAADRESAVSPADRATREVFLAFVDREYDLVVRFLRRQGASSADAQDATQEAFILAWHHLSPYGWGPIRDPRAWVRRVALRKYHRPGGRRSPAGTSEYLVAEVPDTVCERAEHADETVRTLTALAAIASLETELREVLAFRMDGFTSVEIAEILGTTDQKVRDRLKKARRILRARLADAADPQEGLAP